MGPSLSKSASEQRAQSNLYQSYQGSCDISCNNVMSDVDITLINSDVGGVELTQSCAVDGICTMNNASNTLSDILFKAKNSTNAKNAVVPLQLDVALSESRQDIQQAIDQVVNQKCAISSNNQMTDVTIYAANSNIGNGVKLDQDGKASGGCALTSTMSAAAYATGMATNVATSGKDKKAEKGKSVWAVVGIAIAIIVVVLVGSKAFSTYLAKKSGATSTTSAESGTAPTAPAARVRAAGAAGAARAIRAK